MLAIGTSKFSQPYWQLVLFAIIYVPFQGICIARVYVYCQKVKMTALASLKEFIKPASTRGGESPFSKGDVRFYQACIASQTSLIHKVDLLNRFATHRHQLKPGCHC